MAIDVGKEVAGLKRLTAARLRDRTRRCSASDYDREQDVARPPHREATPGSREGTFGESETTR